MEYTVFSVCGSLCVFIILCVLHTYIRIDSDAFSPVSHWYQAMTLGHQHQWKGKHRTYTADGWKVMLLDHHKPFPAGSFLWKCPNRQYGSKPDSSVFVHIFVNITVIPKYSSMWKNKPQVTGLKCYFLPQTETKSVFI